MNRPIIQLILIHFREFAREPGILFWSIVFPIAMAWVLGVAFTTKSDVVQKVALIKNPIESNESLQLFLKKSEPGTIFQGKLFNTFSSQLKSEKLGNTVITFIITSQEDAIILLKRGVISVIIKEEKQKLIYQFDPKSSEAKSIYWIISNSVEKQIDIFKDEQIVPFTKTGTRYIDFLVPGLIALGIMNSCLWGISYSLINNRVKKLLRRMVATPMQRSSYMISHIIARLILGTVEAFLLFLFAFFYFHINIEGSIFAFGCLFASGHIAFSGISIFIASRTANLEVGNGYINAITMPMMVLSGIFFSYHNFPDWTIPIFNKLPLTMLADGLRSVFLEGAGLREISLSLLVLCSTGLVFGGIGMKIYKWH